MTSNIKHYYFCPICNMGYLTEQQAIDCSNQPILKLKANVGDEFYLLIDKNINNIKNYCKFKLYYFRLENIFHTNFIKLWNRENTGYLPHSIVYTLKYYNREVNVKNFNNGIRLNLLEYTNFDIDNLPKKDSRILIFLPGLNSPFANHAKSLIWNTEGINYLRNQFPELKYFYWSYII